MKRSSTELAWNWWWLRLPLEPDSVEVGDAGATHAVREEELCWVASVRSRGLEVDLGR
jgi:hypothetical protein